MIEPTPVADADFAFFSLDLVSDKGSSTITSSSSANSKSGSDVGVSDFWLAFGIAFVAEGVSVFWDGGAGVAGAIGATTFLGGGSVDSVLVTIFFGGGVCSVSATTCFDGDGASDSSSPQTGQFIRFPDTLSVGMLK